LTQSLNNKDLKKVVHFYLQNIVLGCLATFFISTLCKSPFYPFDQFLFVLLTS